MKIANFLPSLTILNIFGFEPKNIFNLFIGVKNVTWSGNERNILKFSLMSYSGTPEMGKGGAGAPPAFRLGEQGSKSALFKCNDLFSNC